jgi:putative transposase
MDLDKAFRDCFDRHQPLKRLPVFKRKGRGDGMRFPQGFRIDNRRLFLPKIGWIGFYRSRDIEGHVKNITVTRKADRWYASIQVEQEHELVKHPSNSEIGIDAGVKCFAAFSQELESVKHPSNSEIGIDVGIKCFAAFSDGTLAEGVNSFGRHEAALARHQRRLARQQKGSENWKRSYQGFTIP